MRFGVNSAPVAMGLAALALVGGAAPALASFGAFAYDEAAGKYGASWDQATEKEADAAALKGCPSDKCKIVFRTAAGQCGAIAVTERESLGRREAAEARGGRKSGARQLSKARQGRRTVQGETRRLQQIRPSSSRFFAVVLLALALFTYPAAAETIPLKKHPGGGYTIAGRLNDTVALTFILDTGASDVSIPDEVARELEAPASSTRGLHRHANVCSSGRLENPEPARSLT